MTANSSTKINIPDHRSTHVGQETQYGIVWPDNTLTWQEITRGPGKEPIPVSDIVPGSTVPTIGKWSKTYWTEMLESRAGAAKLDVDEYRDLHRFVKRTIILSVTETEEA